QSELPTPKLRKAIPERQTGMLVLQRDGAILLEQRPSPGIWGGLWSLPEFDAGGDPTQAARQLGLEPTQRYELAAFAHTFTHYRLHIKPWYLPVDQAATIAEPTMPRRWASLAELPSLALPAPIRKLLEGLLEAGLPE